MKRKAEIIAVGRIVDDQPVDFVFGIPSCGFDGIRVGEVNADGVEVFGGWTLDELREKARERDEALQEPEYLALVRELRE